MEHEKWHWQEPGTAWRGVGVYHITLTVPSREPLLGTLVIPEDNPQAAWIERTALGDAVIKEQALAIRELEAQKASVVKKLSALLQELSG